MKRNTSVQNRIRLSRPVIHTGLILVVFWLWLKLRAFTDLIPFVQLRIPVIDYQETMIFAVLAAWVFFLLWVRNGLYELTKPLHSYYRRFLKSRTMRVALMFSLAYLWFWFVFVSGISRFVLLRSGAMFFVLCTLFDRIRNTLHHTEEVKHPYRLILLWEDSSLKWDIRESFGLYDIYQILDHPGYTLPNHTDRESALVVGNCSPKHLQALADQTRILGKQFYHISDHLSLEDLISSPARVWPVMALEYVASPLDGRRRVRKRAFDLLVSSCAIVVLSPLLILVAIIIKTDSEWPALYTQKRVGKNGDEFVFMKFRSMYTHLSVGENFWWTEAWKLKQKLMNSDQNVRKWALQKIENDPRVTRVGAFLRKSSLDELPNLFNVFRWTMSLVWPRPHEPFEVAKYEHRQKRLLSAKPGMTWYAQLFGRDQLPFDEEAKLDLYYIQNRTVALDFFVLVSTVKVLFRGR